MRSGKFLLGTSAMLGVMTAAERAKGRYMRAPDGHDEFAEFEAAGTVEVGSEQKDADDGAGEAKPAAKKGGGSGKPPKEKPAAEPAAKKPAVESNVPDEGAGDGEGEGDEDENDDEDEGDEEEQQPKPRKKASERIKELNARLRREERLRVASDERLARLEKSLLPAEKGGAKSEPVGKAPDPTDTEKYPFGHLDERYVEDRLQYLVEKKASEQADAALQRQQGEAQRADAETQQKALLEKVDTLSDRGSAEYEDYQEAVVDAGMKGEWDLGQATFEAAFDAEFGHQILYELSQDKKEATRVSKLSPYNQMKFVLERNSEIAKSKTPRKIPGAGAPPETQTRGANSRTRGNPATDNLDDFEKQWDADAKGKR